MVLGSTHQKCQPCMFLAITGAQGESHKVVIAAIRQLSYNTVLRCFKSQRSGLTETTTVRFL